MFNWDSTPNLLNVIISGNYGTEGGGGALMSIVAQA